MNSAKNHFNFQIISKSWDHYEFKVTRLLHSWMTRQWNASLKELQVTYMTSLGICFYWPNTWCYLKDASKNSCLSCKPQFILSFPVPFFTQGIAMANYYYIYLRAQKVNCFTVVDSQFFSIRLISKEGKTFWKSWDWTQVLFLCKQTPLPPDLASWLHRNMLCQSF